MDRDALLALRDATQARLVDRKRIGDFDAHAPTIRELLETQLKLIQHLLDRMRKS